MAWRAWTLRLALLLFLGPGWAAAQTPNQACADKFQLTGMPRYLGSDPPDHVLLCRLGYALSHNTESKIPDWVIELVSREHIQGDADRGGNPFAPDPDLEQRKRSELADYAKSGFDRGHMAPAGDMKWFQDAMDQSFYLSNMSPQIGPGMNRGIWARLEDAVRGWVESRGDLVVMTGPVHATDRKKEKTIGDGKVAVPESFYKIVYDPVLRRAIAFLLPNQSIAGSDYGKYITTIVDIEARTGLDFLSKLPQREQVRLKGVKSTLWRNINQH